MGENTVWVGLLTYAAVGQGRGRLCPQNSGLQEAPLGPQTGPFLLPNSKTKTQPGLTMTQGVHRNRNCDAAQGAPPATLSARKLRA